MPVQFANSADIQSQLVDILNAGDDTFSPVIATGSEADNRRSNRAIHEARRTSAHRILDAIGGNPSHPYWGELKTNVAVANGGVIPACYGEIGTPQIVPATGQSAIAGTPKDESDVDTALNNNLGTLTDFFGEQDGDPQQHDEVQSGFIAPMSSWYNTSNGVIKFTGLSCEIPMIKAGETEAEYRSIADNKMPVTLVATNIRLAIGLLIKEGDTLQTLAGVYAQQGEADLVIIKGGALEVAPINVARSIQNAQRYR